MRSADLTPPLGYPGGPCHVVHRVYDEIANPRLQERLTEKVEKGKSLSNPEASKVYDLEGEKGIGLFKKLYISSHAQYRMDLRGIVVPEIRVALASFQKQLNDWKSRQDVQWNLYTDMLSRGGPVEWTDPRIHLTIIFRVAGRGAVKLITAYWKGLPDPRGPGLGRCPVVAKGYQNPAGDLSGTRTFVTDPNADQPPATGPGHRYKQRALPSPPWVHHKPTKNWVYNVPGPSDEAPGGDPIHTDRMRTQPQKGKEPPKADPRKRPKRRDIEGAVRGKRFPPFQDRQRKQKGRAKRYYKRWYRKNRSKVRRRSERWYRRWKNRIQLKRDKERRRDKPERFERRPGGGVRRNKERAKEYRKEKKKEQKSKGKKKTKKGALSFPFIHLPTNIRGVLQEVDPDTGMAEVKILSSGITQYIPIDDLLEDILLLGEGDVDRLEAYLDRVFEWADEDIDEIEGDEDDTLLEDWFVSQGFNDIMNLPEDRAQRIADFLLERRPPGDRQNWNDRATPNLSEKIDRKEDEPATKIDRGQVTNNPGSAKVIPDRSDMVNNKEWKGWGWSPPLLPDVAASNSRYGIMGLRENEQEALVELVRSPLWERYAVGAVKLRDILRWFRDQGVRMTAKRWNQIQTRIQPMMPSISRTAARIFDIRKGCDPELYQKARTVPVKLRRVDSRNSMWLFDAKGSSGDTYRVRVKAQARKGIKDPRKADLLVSCSCPFWRWQGPEHWAKKEGYLLGRPRGTASKPDIKDPRGQHRACKHILAVLDKIEGFASLPGRRASLQYLSDRFRTKEDVIRSVVDRYLKRAMRRR